MKPCGRCGQLFRAIHGNQLYCSSCRMKRPSVGRRRYTTATSLGRRICVYCGRAYEARADNQRYCSQRCKDQAKPAEVKAKYARPSHRLGRQAWASAVATGHVRCARGVDCKHAERIHGELVGGFIRGPWDLGHRDGESSGGPEHRDCNRGAPSRLRATQARVSRVW
jgi:hypothetical protein